ncbi:apolipoprotein N-acyltransferase [Maritalea mediterranea]|uniref:Apolipoprotein N-acyltransferase n=1 Tax=Maritalea mediterranea TaxID=2909667 RepID=A0ABS9E2B7_9HYPH|nr:apolipoprotein N-acyltransferase [Maritalea mediterranea]MCF4097002.1 apolipoprotein N-acyltransferase [Maritalea mediterranea]
MRLSAIADWCILSHGFKRYLALFSLGALAALALPPFKLLPLFFIGIAALVWFLDGVETQSGWRKLFGPAFWTGWAFGFGYFTVGLHWLGAAFFVDGDLFLWALPIGILGLPAFLAIFWALGTAFAHMLWSDYAQRIFALAAFLALFEFLRGIVLTGLPFNVPGYVLTAHPYLMQSAAFFGVHGLSFVALLVGASFALLASPLPGDRARFLPLLALAALALMVGLGAWRYHQPAFEARPDLRLRLVQPNIPQQQKWDPQYRDAIFNSLLSLSQAQIDENDPGLIGSTHLIWPESAFPFYVAEEPEALARIARMLPKDTLLITGAARRSYDLGGFADQEGGVFNSILAINDQGEIIASYDKRRLVPFGEYLPLKPLLTQLGLRKFVAAADSFVKGTESGLKFAPQNTPALLPLICYEVIFSGALGDQTQGAQWILNLTNDAWFQGTIGPAQHAHHARVRAVEQGLPLVRVANTGHTIVTDPLGRIITQLPPDQPASASAQIPHPLEKTLFSQYTYLLFFIVIGATIFAVLLRNRWRRTWEN